MYYLEKKTHGKATMRKYQTLLGDAIVKVIYGITLIIVALTFYSILFDQELIIEWAIRAGAIVEWIMEG